MKAVILAGGRGIRLGQITREIPKPMIPVGDLPLLHHQVNLLVKYGIREIILLVNYLYQPIEAYFGDGTEFGASISYFEEKIPLGTVGGIKAIEDQLSEDFIVLYGDVMINMDLSRFILYHRQKKSACTLVLHPNDHPYDSDLVEINEEGRITAFHSKPHDPATWYHNLVNAGAYLFSSVVLDFLEKDKKADFGGEVFPRIIKELPMFGYQTAEYLKDMGTPDRLELVRNDLHSGKIARSSYEYKQRAVFLDRDGVLNVERSYISRPDELELYDFTPLAVRKINQAGYLSVVVTNQSAIARNLCTEEDVDTIHRKMETDLGHDRAWLDAVYFCPHHPDKGFPDENPKYKIECDCRKPKTGMFRKAIEKFNIDPSASYMIGDSERDILAGMNAGCTTIGVRSGYGIKKTKFFPDYMFTNLAEAVDFIVDDPFAKEFQKIVALYRKYQGNKPWVILIGGNTRTGKSTLATYLHIGFQKAELRALQVGLDNWLLPADQRSEDMGVYDRFQLPVVTGDLQKLIEGRTLRVTSYVNHPERKSAILEYNPDKMDIIIIDGVVALSSPVIRLMAHLKIFMTLSQDEFLKRIEDYYHWRGASDNEIKHLVHKRQKDEYQIIEKESNLADLIIKPSSR